MLLLKKTPVEIAFSIQSEDVTHLKEVFVFAKSLGLWFCTDTMHFSHLWPQCHNTPEPKHHRRKSIRDTWHFCFCMIASSYFKSVLPICSLKQVLLTVIIPPDDTRYPS